MTEETESSNKEDMFSLLPGTPRLWAKIALAAVLATIFISAFTLYAVASWTNILPRGPVGIAGAPGGKGPNGLRGTKGTTGPTGFTGYRGDPGDTGPAGKNVPVCSNDKSDSYYEDVPFC